MPEPTIEPKAKEEKPVLQTPEPKGEPQVPDPMESAKVLMETLNKLGVDSSDPQAAATKLENMHYASSQMGDYARKLGDERKRAEALEVRLAALEQRPAQQPPDTMADIYGQPAQAPIRPDDIRQVMRQEIGNYISMQNQATQMQLKEFARIKGDAEFPVVEELFNKHVSNPHIQLAMQTGETNLRNEYDRVKVSFYRNLAMQARNTVQGLMERTQKGAQPPHMESSAGQTFGLPVQSGTREELLELKKKSTGTDDDLDAQLQKLFPDTDQFLYQAEEIKEGRFMKGRQ